MVKGATMSIIKECEFCVPVENDTRTYRKQTEIYDGIAEVLMCWSCGNTALFERQRIIKLLEDYEWTEIFIPTLIALIKGENE